MTNPIGTGTCNIAINCPVDERTELGRLAVRLGFRSTGELSRHLILKGLEQVDTDSASNVREIRRKYYGATMLAVFLVALIFGHDDLTRSGRRVRRVVEENIEEVTEA